MIASIRAGLAAAFAGASEGRPSLGLLAGEAGVGKSRLVAQATGAEVCRARRAEEASLMAQGIFGSAARDSEGGGC